MISKARGPEQSSLWPREHFRVLRRLGAGPKARRLLAERSFLKEAFLMPQNLIGLGAVVAGLVLLPLGPLATPLFIAAGVFEGIYLGAVSQNPRFQRMIRSRRLR